MHVCIVTSSFEEGSLAVAVFGSVKQWLFVTAEGFGTCLKCPFVLSYVKIQIWIAKSGLNEVILESNIAALSLNYVEMGSMVQYRHRVLIFM